MRFADDFDAPGLDTEVWVPHYLPQWSSHEESAATYAIADSELRLTIPPQQGLWCPGDHAPLKVSGVQSGVFSGAVGSTIGQQPVHDGALVREFQPTQRGRVDFLIHDEHVKTVDQAPDYPMQMMVAVFDFPDKPGPADHVPELAVDFVRER